MLLQDIVISKIHLLGVQANKDIKGHAGAPIQYGN